MGTIPSTILIDCQSVARDWGDGDFKTEMVEAFKRTYDANIVMFCVTDEERFKVGAAAGFLKANEDDKKWIQIQLQNLAKISALFNAAQLGLEVKFPNDVENTRDYTLLGLYKEAQSLIPEWLR